MSQNIPILIGVTSHEGAQFVAQVVHSMDLPVENYRKAAEMVYNWLTMGFYRGSKQVRNITKLLMETYLSEQDTPEQLAQGLVSLYSHLNFVVSTLQVGIKQSGKPLL